MNSNILLINEDGKVPAYLKEKLNLLRQSDGILSASFTNVKKLQISTYIDLILFSDGGSSKDDIIKTIEYLKRTFPQAEIIMLRSSFGNDTSEDYYSAGVYDIVNVDSDILSFKISIMNALKLVSLKHELEIARCFLETTSACNPKNKLYNLKNLKECYYSLIELPHVKNGVYVIITIDESVRTKVSVNRLSLLLQKKLRKTDIICFSNNKFHIILGNTTPAYAKSIVVNISANMGNDFKLRSGVSSIGFNDYDTVVKNASDSLKSAMNNDLLCVSLSDNISEDVSWINNDEKNKQFKIFKSAFTKKLKNIIEPLFFRFEKECDSALKNTEINQYANEIESVFSLKNKNLHSELVIHYNGFTKLNVKITHSGLETPDNTECEFYLNKFDEKNLSKLLKQLKQEYKMYS